MIFQSQVWIPYNSTGYLFLIIIIYNYSFFIFFNIFFHLNRQKTVAEESPSSSGKSVSSTSPKTGGKRKPMMCEICDEILYTYKEFKKHLVTHYKSQTYVCNLCKRSYIHKNTIQVHLTNFHNKPINSEDVDLKDVSVNKWVQTILLIIWKIIIFGLMNKITLFLQLKSKLFIWFYFN